VIFRFRRSEVQPSPVYPSGVIDRPEVPIGIASGDRQCKPFLGLLDTGSDDTKLPISVAERLGVSLDRDHPILFRGVGGTTLGYYGEVVLELRQSPKSYRWAAHVAFLPDPDDITSEERIAITLGHAGFFRSFHVGFDYQRRRVRIRPNGLFVGLPI
jgi:hypothetical protein